MTQLKKQKSFLKKIVEKFAITAIYLYALILQLYTIKTMFGSFPAQYYDLIPFLKDICENRVLKFFGSPEKSFLLYLFLTEFVIFQPFSNLPLLVRFNFLYLFILELIQHLFYYCMDFLYTNDFQLVFLNKSLLMPLVWHIYCIFLGIYIYSYSCAIRGRFPKFYGYFQKIVDSVAFWLRVKRVKKEDLQK